MTDDFEPTGGPGAGAERAAAAVAPPRRGRRWVRWALAASICVNLLLIGAAAGAFMRHGGPPRATMPAGFDRVTLWRAFRDLSDDDRDETRDAIRERHGEMRSMAGALTRARAGIASALEARPFDPDALAAALVAAREAERRSGDLADRIFVDVARRLADHSREELAEALREDRGKPRWRRDGDHDRDGDRRGERD